MTVRLALRGGAVELLDLRPERAGAVLVLLHEGLGSVGLWRGFPELLAAATGLRTVAFSRYGHGQSDPPPAPRTPTFMHEEALVVLPEVLDELGIDAPVLVGHSDGGSIALLYAEAFPEGASALILEAPHVFVEDMTVAAIAAAKETFATTDLGARLGRYHADAERTFRGWNDIWLDPRFRTWNIVSSLWGIPVPVLVIQGDDDEYGTSAQVEAIAAAIPGAETFALARSGHSPHRTQTAAVLARTATFLESIPDLRR